MRLGLLLLALGGVACGAAQSGTGFPVPVSAFRPEDRVLLADFSRVNAVAAAYDVAYVAFPTAVGIWRPLTARWEVPRTPPRPGMLRDVRGAVIDPGDQSLWLITDRGWIHYSPNGQRWDEGIFPGTPTTLATDPMDPRGGIWVRLGGSWYVQPRFGAAMPGSPSAALRLAPTIEDALRDMPSLRALAPRLVTGQGLEQGRITGAAPLPDGSGWLLGTTNRGLLKVDRMGMSGTPLPLGLRGTMVGALAIGVNSVWVATDADRWPSAELAQLSRDLAISTVTEGREPFGLPFAAARKIVLEGRDVWLATDQGVARFQPNGGTWTRWSEIDGLPDARVLTLAEHQGRMVAATMRGMIEIAPDGVVTRIAPRFLEPAYALLSRGDTLWVGTNRGLLAWMPGEDALAEPEGLTQLVGARIPVRGIGYVADTLVAVTDRELLWRNPVSGAWRAGQPLAGLGRINVTSVSDDGIWIGGEAGAAFARPTLGILRRLLVPADLPGPVTAIGVDAEYLWVGTTQGLVRMGLERR